MAGAEAKDSASLVVSNEKKIFWFAGADFFWVRNATKLIKGSKDLDWSLVSNENFSEILWPSGWAPGQVTWAKMPLKLLHSQKIYNPQPKNCFWVQTTRLVESFDGLNSCLVQSAEELWHFLGNCKSAGFMLISRHYIFVDRLLKC